ncbi:Ff.00g042240.m01.CDS01 [Fusarium sp. VM40]|nr:Ff.00g042240.m01.CDS01 [Fusarium sp. VM40]
MDPAKGESIIPAETKETQQQERVHSVLQRAQNTRFDVPEGRNLGNIDHLIAQCTDEREIKEFKQQKRVLRSGQAALESRDRKKQQTERLEDEKKQYTALISDMEEELSQLSRRNEQLLFEKEAHTIETGELRKKVAVLTEHMERLQNALAENNITSQSMDKFGNFERLGSYIWP